jgi:hypothetical protein
MSVLMVAAGCAGDRDDAYDTPDPDVAGDADRASDELIGSWKATGVSSEGVSPDRDDAIDDGMTLTAVALNSGQISVDVKGDRMGLCKQGPDCTLTGTWSSAPNRITLRDGAAEVLTLDYTTSGDEMTWTGMLGSSRATISFDKSQEGRTAS